MPFATLYAEKVQAAVDAIERSGNCYATAAITDNVPAQDLAEAAGLLAEAWLELEPAQKAEILRRFMGQSVERIRVITP